MGKTAESVSHEDTAGGGKNAESVSQEDTAVNEDAGQGEWQAVSRRGGRWHNAGANVSYGGHDVRERQQWRPESDNLFDVARSFGDKYGFTLEFGLNEGVVDPRTLEPYGPVGRDGRRPRVRGQINPARQAGRTAPTGA
jgi:hypothetical protein